LRSLVVILSLAVLGGAIACSAAPGAGLTGKVWQWTASTTQTPASQSVVPDPENYTIEFKTDGTYSAKADCNQVSGSYTTSGTNGLAILPGPSTLVACGDDSLGAIYVAGLTTTTNYAVANSQLTLTQVAGATMTFR